MRTGLKALRAWYRPRRNDIRLGAAMFVSLVFHAVLLSLQIGLEGDGLPGLDLPWQERRAPALALRLAPPAAPLQGSPQPVAPAAPLPLPPAPPPPLAAATSPMPPVPGQGWRFTAVAPAPPAPAPVPAKPAAPAPRAALRRPLKRRAPPRPRAPDITPLIASARIDDKTFTIAPAQEEPAPPEPVPDTVLAEAEDAARLEREQEESRLLAQQAEREAQEKLKLEQDERDERARLAALAALEAERQREQDEQQRLASQPVAQPVPQADPLLRERVTQERLAERLAATQAEQQRVRQDRLARQAERQREQEEQERLARLAEQQRLEQQRLAQLAEQQKLEQRQLAQMAEQQRQDALAREQRERERLAVQQREEALARAELERRQQEAERLAALQAEQQRLAALDAERDRAAQEVQARAQAAAQEAQRAAELGAAARQMEAARLARQQAGPGNGGQGGEPAKPYTPPAGADLVSRALRQARDATRNPWNDGRGDFPSPARRSILGNPDNDIGLAMYIDSWRRKIERNGELNFSRLAAESVRVDPIVTVSLRSDGSVEEVTINRSSGRPDLDEAVRRIVAVNARYSAFPPNLARKYDVIEIRRVWRFAQTLRVLEDLR